MTHKPNDNLAITARELVSQRIAKMETYDQWLDRLRQENQQAEQESAVDRNTRQRLDAYYGCDDPE